MSSPLANLPTYILASVALLGGFSRFTHGQYTPQFYAFQEYHAPDDGSTTAQITPIIDILIGTSLLFGPKAVRLGAAGLSVVFFSVGTWIQVNSGKEYLADLSLMALGVIAALSQLRR